MAKEAPRKEGLRCGYLAMIEPVDTIENSLYRALFELAQSLSGHNDLQSLCESLDRSLRQVIAFDYLGLALYDADQNLIRLHAATGIQDVESRMTLMVVADSPAEWVLQEQRILVIPDLTVETRWPAFIHDILSQGVCGAAFVPLSNGPRRLGVLAFGVHSKYEPSEVELALAQRVASEAAVTVDAYLMQQQLTQQRDRLQVLFDVTNALVSKLPWNELFASISDQLSRIVKHDFALLTLCDERTGRARPYALHFTGEPFFDTDAPDIEVAGLPTAEALRSGKAVVLSRPDLERFPAPEYQRLVSLGFNASCSIPLITPNGTLGTLEIARISAEPWAADDIDLLVQVAHQIAIAVENSISYRELTETKEKLATENLYLQDEIRSDQNLSNMIGESPAFRALMKSIQIVAPTDASVLVLGETGTGKEMIARAIHDMSERKKRTFVKVNCPAIPATLLESELFGHEKGAFTGALGQKIGRFELADHGTLFLDEVGEIPLELQSKLLRAIQEQEFERLGSNRTIRVDIRVVAATNRDLKAMVAEGKFRSDLYYRLHVFPIEAPPLRDRRSDIPLLIRYFTQKYAQRMNRHIKSIPKAAINALTGYDWPGNIRELQNLIERSVILTQGSLLQVAMPESQTSTEAMPARRPALSSSREREKILLALKQTSGVVGGENGAAARLGLRRTTLQSRMKKLNIGRDYH
jgi:formate hydrogenlyase transcriptional activator